MSATPLVSIVLCTYNGEAYLAAQMETLLAQTYPHLEIIVSDDASTDNTFYMLKEYAASDQRIQLHQNKSNLGFNKNFEQALQKASGEWCAIADQDDIWRNDKIEIMMRHSDGCALVHCSSTLFATGEEPSAKKYSGYQKFEGHDARKNFLYNTFEGHCLLIKKEVALGSMPFPEGVYYDRWLGMYATANGGVCWVKDVLTFRRLHPANASTQLSQQEKSEKTTLPQLIKTIDAFLTIKNLREEEKDWGLQLKKCLALRLEGKPKPLYHFMFRYRTIIFYYKKRKAFSLISHLKAIRKFLKETGG